LLQVADPTLNRLVTARLLQANIFADRALGRLLLKVDVGNPDLWRSALLGLLKGLYHIHLILLLLLLRLCRSEVHALPGTTRVLLLDNFDPLLFLCRDLLAIKPFEVRDSLKNSGAVLGLAAQWRWVHTQLDDLCELTDPFELHELWDARGCHRQDCEPLALLKVHERLQRILV
jgi:hypothetical protein